MVEVNVGSRPLSTDSVVGLYLDLLKRCLANIIYQDPPIPMPPENATKFQLETRRRGGDRPSQAHTMIGLNRLDNLQCLIEEVLAQGVPGDLVEAGVGRGGATIFMRGVLRAHGVRDRTVWVADSFGEFPRSARAGVTPRSYTSPFWAEMAARWQADPKPFLAMMSQVQVGMSLAEVKEHFDRYGLLDDQVRFLAGWFCDTLAAAPIEALSLLRIDADLYDSTYEALTQLYPKLSVGGYAVVDDYHTFPECREAVDFYLAAHAAPVRPERVDDAVFWRKSWCGRHRESSSPFRAGSRAS